MSARSLSAACEDVDTVVKRRRSHLAALILTFSVRRRCSYPPHTIHHPKRDSGSRHVGKSQAIHGEPEPIRGKKPACNRKEDSKHWQQPDPPVHSRRELASSTTMSTVFDDVVRSRFVDAAAI